MATRSFVVALLMFASACSDAEQGPSADGEVQRSEDAVEVWVLDVDATVAGRSSMFGGNTRAADAYRDTLSGAHLELRLTPDGKYEFSSRLPWSAIGKVETRDDRGVWRRTTEGYALTSEGGEETVLQMRDSRLALGGMLLKRQ